MSNPTTEKRTIPFLIFGSLNRLSTFILLVVVFSGVQLSFGQTNEFAQVISQTNHKMVKVVGAGIGNVEGYASGILISADGLILSTQGVFLDGNSVQVILWDGSAFEATVLRRDRKRQLSLLKIDAQTPDHFVLGEEDFGEQGDWIAAVSNAYRVADKDESLSVMMGVISLRTSIDAKLNGRDTAYSGPLVVLDAITSNPGAAGGAVIDRDGNLVGLIGKIIDSSETNTRLNYAVPRSLLNLFVTGKIDQQINDMPVPDRVRIDLGIKIFELSGKNALPFVDKVSRDGLAAKAGIRPDDLVVSINGTKLSNVKDYLKAAEQLYDDQPVVVVVARGTKNIKRLILWEPQSKTEDHETNEHEADHKAEDQNEETGPNDKSDEPPQLVEINSSKRHQSMVGLSMHARSITGVLPEQALLPLQRELANRPKQGTSVGHG